MTIISLHFAKGDAVWEIAATFWQPASLFAAHDPHNVAQLCWLNKLFCYGMNVLPPVFDF